MTTTISIDLESAARLLKAGECVAIPTETVYGLGANALDENAVVKIFEAKNRPFFDPLIVHISDSDQMNKFTSEIPPIAKKLADAFWPGPLTLLLPKSDAIPYLVTSGLDTVGLRVPNHPLALSLLRSLPFPLAAPSANPFGYISPTTAQHVLAQLAGRISMVLDGGPCGVGVESTIVQCTGDVVSIVRLGGLCVEDIESVAGKVNLQLNASANPMAPGQLSSHYAPRKPMLVGNIDEIMKQHLQKKMAVLSFSESYEAHTNQRLSPMADVNEAAKNLFGMMRQLDSSDAEIIIAEWLPEVGLGRAVNDRLRRAAHQ